MKLDITGKETGTKEFLEYKNQFDASLFDKIIPEYRITETRKKEDKAIIVVTGKIIDIDKSNLSTDRKFEAYVDKYFNENKAMLQQIYVEQGEEALINKVTEGTMYFIYEISNEILAEAVFQDFSLTFTVVKDKEVYEIASATYKEY